MRESVPISRSEGTTEELLNGYRLLQRGPHCRLGMDAVFLAAFLSMSKMRTVCDLGCGAGAVAMLLAARYPDAAIDGVEVQPTAAALFEENIRLNATENRVRSVRADLRNLSGILPAGAYTAVVCNPPYFAAKEKKPPGGAATLDSYAFGERVVERSGVMADVTDVCNAAARLLKNGGEFAAVYRAERLCDILCAMRAAGIEPKRVKFIQNTGRSAPKLFLISGRRNALPGIRPEPPMILRNDDGTFTDEYHRVYRGEII